MGTVAAFFPNILLSAVDSWHSGTVPYATMLVRLNKYFSNIEYYLKHSYSSQDDDTENSGSLSSPLAVFVCDHGRFLIPATITKAYEAKAADFVSDRRDLFGHWCFPMGKS